MNPLAFLRGLVRLVAARPQPPRSLRGNPTLRLILERRSVRRFLAREIPDDHWLAILEAGRLAPSTVNLQTWSFGCFTADEWRETFGRSLPYGAARAVIVLTDTQRARRVVPDFPAVPLCDHTVGVMNASLAAMAMTLAAEALGLGSVMLSETGRTGFYDARELSEVLALPPGVVPITTIAFGWPATVPVMPPKLPLDAITFTGRYRPTPQAVLEAWFEQMRSGYLAATGQSFQKQIDHYNRRLGEAEADLRRLVLPDQQP
ncbi:MAG: nitroreductase family protein [Candidatus Krumholzibacteriia bacterium]